MRAFRVEGYFRAQKYKEYASRFFPEDGEEALERCKQSLIAGAGLCKGELRFLQRLRFLSQSFGASVGELDEFIENAKDSIVRIPSEEEKEYWRNFFQNKRLG